MTAVYAADLHVGDVIQQTDWHLHVTAVDMDPEAPGSGIAVAVTEFAFLLHYPARRLLDVERVP